MLPERSCYQPGLAGKEFETNKHSRRCQYLMAAATVALAGGTLVQSLQFDRLNRISDASDSEDRATPGGVRQHYWAERRFRQAVVSKFLSPKRQLPASFKEAGGQW